MAERRRPEKPAGARPAGRRSEVAAREDELLDEALEETFPASDPIAPFCDFPKYRH
jgi:hypothetical protein